jgi:predicted transcriptional regulator
VFVLFTFVCVLSSIYSINSHKTDNKNNRYISANYNFENLPFPDTYQELFSIGLEENYQILHITRYFEEALNEFEEIFLYFSLTGSLLSLEVITLFKTRSINGKTAEPELLDIEGVNVTKDEMKVFNFIQEFLSSNKVFTKEKVTIYIQSISKVNSNLNYNGIKSVIDSLITKNIVVEGSKLTRKTILLNSNRKKIYNIITENPGIYMYALVKQLDVSPFVIKWHLSLLIKFQLIRVQSFNDKFSYFEFTFNKENDMIFHTITREKCRKIIELLKIHKNGLRINQISKELKMHYNTITKYLDKLDEFNLLIRDKVNTAKTFSLNYKNYQVLIQSIINTNFKRQ